MSLDKPNMTVAGPDAQLKSEIEMAIAWGVPDNESTGMSRDRLISLLSRALNRIKYLERKVERT